MISRSKSRVTKLLSVCCQASSGQQGSPCRYRSDLPFLGKNQDEATSERTERQAHDATGAPMIRIFHVGKRYSSLFCQKRSEDSILEVLLCVEVGGADDETGESQVWGLSGLKNEFRSNLGNLPRSHIKIKRKESAGAWAQ